MKRSGITGIRMRTRANALARWMARLLPMAVAGSLCLSCNRGGSASDNPSLDRYKQSGRRIETTAKSIELALSAPHATLVTSGLAAKPTAPAVPPRAQVQAEVRNIAFKLTGIVGNKRAPLVLTSAGVAGLGEEVDGFKVVEIQETSVTFMDKGGRKLKVNLYKDAFGP